MRIWPNRRTARVVRSHPRYRPRLETLEERIVPVQGIVGGPPIEPQLVVTSPAATSTVPGNVTVTGKLTDLRAVPMLQATIDGGAKFNVALVQGGSFEFQTDLPLDGSADGLHAVRLFATDSAGGSATAGVSFTLNTSLVNRAVTTNTEVQQQPSIAVDPTNGKHEVIAYLDYSLLTTGYAGIGVAVTENNGVSWMTSSIPLPAGFSQGADSPTVQFNAQGQVFVSFAAVTFLGQQPPLSDPGGGDPRALGFTSNNGIFVAQSDDGGVTWNTPVAVASNIYSGTPVNFEIKPDLAIDTFATMSNDQTNPYYGSLYVTWSRYYSPGQFPGEPTATGGSDIMIAVSRDAGQTWQIELQAQSGTGIPVSVIGDFPNEGLTLASGVGHANWSQVTVGPDGDIYVIQGPNLVLDHHSTDGGASFTQPNPGESYNPFGDLGLPVPNGTLANDQFRTQRIYDLVADPTRPGYLYFVTTEGVANDNGSPLAPAVLLFARSTDYGATWQTTFEVGGKPAHVLNDDNDGQIPTGAPGDVIDGQAMPQMAIDAHGNIAVIWYDTRRDPADTLLDVYGTVSTDGGQDFSPNFRITSQSFNPNAGSFTDATGQTDYYLGDRIGLALANGTAYAAWTDTLSGNQDIEFTRFAISPPPAPPSNRYAPNNTAALATALGPVVTRLVPKLTIAAGDEEWFRVQAAATGALTVSAALSAPGDTVRLELFNASGTALLATGSAMRGNGQIIGQTLTYPGQFGQTYLVRVLPGPRATAKPAEYSLDMQSLTANLGTQVYGVKAGSLAKGAQAYYALTAPAAGSLAVILTPGAKAKGNFQLAILNPNDQSVMAAGQAAGADQFASLTLTQGQAFYLRVTADVGAQGAFTLQFTNLDQYVAPDNKSLFFPTGGNPSEVALADLTGNGREDIVVDYADQNIVSVLLNNGNGTFQAPRDYAVDAFQAGNNSTTSLADFTRAMVIADFAGNGIPDIAVLNYKSGGISLLMGNGDGTFAPQRFIATVGNPFGLAAGDLTGNGITDLVVVNSSAATVPQGEVLLGHGDGTFQSPKPFTIPADLPFSAVSLELADVNGDGKEDLVYEGGTIWVLLGNGDGTFQPAIRIGTATQGGFTVADLNGDGKLDLAFDNEGLDGIDYYQGNGDGTFQPPVDEFSGEYPVAVAVADFSSQITLPDGATVLGPPDGIPDLIVANNGLIQNVSVGPPGIVVLPGLVDAHGAFAGFGAPIPFAAANAPLDLALGDLDGNGQQAVVVAESNGVEVIQAPANASPAIGPLDVPPADPPTDLGTVVHVLEPTLTIVPGHEEDNYTLTVPTEAAAGAGNEVLDFSGDFQALQGAGITMQVLDASGHVLGSGDRFRISAPQGAVLTVRVFGLTDKQGNQGSGAYTLDIDVLPQVVSVQAQPLLPGATSAPGGATASLVLTLQGDRLDPTSAQNPANYTVTYLGQGGNQVIPITSVVYDPSTNVDVASGTTYPTAVKQTLTFLFNQPLPAGSYQITVTAGVQTAAFNTGEAGQLAPAAGFTGHPVVTLAAGTVTEGSHLQAANLVQAAGALGSFSVWAQGTPFFQQLHDDLSAILDSELTQGLTDAQITTDLQDQIQSRFDPALGQPGQRPASLLVLWTDPVSLDLTDPSGDSMDYNLGSGQLTNGIGNSWVSVVGNIEVIVIAVLAPLSSSVVRPDVSGSYTLTVSDVPATARGGAVLLSQGGDTTPPLTTALQGGTTVFNFTV